VLSRSCPSLLVKQYKPERKRNKFMSRVTKAQLAGAISTRDYYMGLYTRSSQERQALWGQVAQLQAEVNALREKNRQIAMAGLQAAGEVAQGYEQEINTLQTEHTQTLDKCAAYAAIQIKQAQTDTMAQAFKYLADRVTTPNQG
jgi:FtsZ-binding cell division protein ZapB